MHDGLLGAVFEQAKILFLKPENEAIQRVRDYCRNEYKGGFGIETGGLIIRRGRGLARGSPETKNNKEDAEYGKRAGYTEPHNRNS